MIISPPFLPSQAPAVGREADAAEANNLATLDRDVCAVGMQECAPGNGAYPVSYNFGWHGGAHLMAPRAANGHAEPVRAIADGTVVFVRHNSAEGKPELQYRNVRSDDGCVVIKHTTEIGDGGGHASRAKVTYFSVYMHLQTVVGALAVGKPIYRKDTLGAPGHIYGQAGQIHFEIVCDVANLEKLVGRKSGPLTARQGRTDAVYGDVWFKVPRGVKLFEREPHPYRRDDADSPPGPHASVQRQIPIAETSTPLVIRMRFGQSKAGDCTLTTFKQDGDRWIELGHVTDPDYEYSLYKRACDLNARYHALGRAHRVVYDAPAPSAIYEMLRFGRILGPDVITSSMRFGHWRKVVTPEGTGWINLCPPELNPDVRGMSEKPKIGVFSDADFPHWDGWGLVDDDTGRASQCESATIKNWLDSNGDGKLTHAEAVAALHNDDVKRRMSRAICRFPTEWSKQGIEARWGWLKSPHEALVSPMTDDDFAAMKAHIEALAFWEEINDQDLPPADQCWRFPPKAFVEHFRKCGWVSEVELARTIPSASYGSVSRFKKSINVVVRKYINSSKVRVSHFLGQVAHETSNLSGPMVEGGNNKKSREYESDQSYYRGPDSYIYFSKGGGYERLRNTLGNEYNSGDGIKFRGRGSLQITGRDAYSRYWLFRGWLRQTQFDKNWWLQKGWWSIPRNPSIRPASIEDPQRISARANGNEFNPIDVGGWFWAANRINDICDDENPASPTADRSFRVSKKINFYDEATFVSRQKRTERAKEVLCDIV